MSTAALPRPSLRGTAWLSLRQERTTLLAAGGILLAFTTWVLLFGRRISVWIDSNGLRNCNDVYYPPECSDVSDLRRAIPEWWPPAVSGTGWVLFLLPFALGLFAGAPLLAREFESGTHRLAWTQSVSRTRWLAGRLAAPFALTLVGSAVLAGAASWWRTVIEGRFGVPGYYHWFGWMARSTEGPSTIAFCLVGLAVGVTAGLLVRRVVAAMAVTAVLTAGLRLAVDDLRDVFTPAVEVEAPVRLALMPQNADIRELVTGYGFPAESPLNSEILATGYRTSDGITIAGQGNWPPYALPDGSLLCQDSGCEPHVATVDRAFVLFHPPAHEWPMLWTQTGICLAVTALLLGLCFLRVRRMH